MIHVFILNLVEDLKLKNKALKIKFISSVSIFFSLWVVYVLKAIWKPYPLAGDEPNYLFNSVILSKFGTVHSRQYYSSPELVSTIYPGGVLSPHVIGDSTVSYHGIGLSILLLPATLFENPVFVSRMIMSTIVALVFTIIHHIMGRIHPTNYPKWLSSLSVLFVGLGAPVIFNVDLLYAEFVGTLIILLVAYIGYKLVKLREHVKSELFLMSICLLFLPWLHVRFIPVTFFLLVVIFYESLRQVKLVKSVKTLVVPYFVFTVSLLMTSLAYKSWFGTYDIFFQRNYQVSGLKTMDFAGIYRTMGSYLFSGSEGLFAWQPGLIFALFGLPAMFYVNKRLTMYFCSLIAVYFLTITQAGAMGGDTPPLHYMALIIPFLAFPLLFCFRAIYSAVMQSRRWASTRTKLEDLSPRENKSGLWKVTTLGLLILTFWGSLLSLSGTTDRGSTFIRSGIQGYPITSIATAANSFWPGFMGPNLSQNYSLARNGNPWIQSDNGTWTYSASQGYRPIDAYLSTASLQNPSERDVEVTFTVYAFDNRVLSDFRGSNVKLCEEKTNLAPKSTFELSVPCNINYLSEVSWGLVTTNPEVVIIETKFLAIPPQKESLYSDLGFFIMAILALTLITRLFGRNFPYPPSREIQKS